MKVTVTQTIQSGDNEPVQVLWGKDITALAAASSITTILKEADEGFVTDVPESIRYRTLSIRVDLTETEGK